MKVARILLAILTLSVLVVPLLELGHGLLHSFENPFHYHQIHVAKKSENHTLKQHHFPKMKFAHEMEEHQPCSGFVILLYCFYQPLTDFSFTIAPFTQNHSTRFTEYFLPIDFTPPFRPPSV